MKKIVFIVIALGIYAGGLLYKNEIKLAEKSSTPPTMSQIRKEQGIPVHTVKVEKSNFEKKIKISGFVNKNGLLKAELTSDVISKINTTNKASLKFDDKVFLGRFLNISKRPNLLTGLYEASIQFENLPVGIVGRISVVNVSYKVIKDVIVLQRSAVSFREKSPFVYGVNNQSKLVKKQVVIKEGNDDEVLISLGVAPGEVIVTSDQRYLSENDFIYNVDKREK